MTLMVYTRVFLGVLLRLARFPFDIYASVLTDLIDIVEGRPERPVIDERRAHHRLTVRPARTAPELVPELMGEPQLLLAGGTTLPWGVG